MRRPGLIVGPNSCLTRRGERCRPGRELTRFCIEKDLRHDASFVKFDRQ